MTEKERLARIEELKKEIYQVKKDYDYYRCLNLALKLVLNGTYGSFCHPAFSVSNTNIANAITANAREVIIWMLDHIEEYFYNHWHEDDEAHKLIGTNYISIGEDGKYYYHRPDGKLVDNFGRADDTNSTGLQKIFHDYHLSQSNIAKNDKEEIVLGDKKYKVVQKIFICDFSKVNPISKEYDIEPDPKSPIWDETRGVRKEPLVIYGDTDSIYLSFKYIAQTIDYDITNIDDGLKFILHINGNFIKFLFEGWLNDYAEKYHVKNMHNFELETINKSGLHVEKKMYINNPVWEDGVFHEDLSHYTPKGLDIVRSSTPVFVRENIWSFIDYLFMNPGNVNVREILKIMKELKKQFKLAPLEDISMTTSLTNYETKCTDDQKDLICVKGAHYSIKAAAFHNFLLNKNSEYKTKYDLLKGGKIKWYFCKHPLNDRFAYMRSFHPDEICQKEGIEIDYDEQFAKTFLSIVNRFIKTLGFSPITKRISILNSLFSNPVKKALKEEKILDIDDEDIYEDEREEDEEKIDTAFDPFWDYDVNIEEESNS